MPTCKMKDCFKDTLARGLCSTHYSNWRNNIQTDGPECSSEECSGNIHARGLCSTHYARWNRHGDPSITHETDHVLKWMKEHLSSDPAEECIEWPHHTNSDGYGSMFWKGKKRLATHIVLEETGTPRPPAPNNYALHSCHNPGCVNSKHLRWGSQKENMQDMIDAGRQNLPRNNKEDENSC